MTSQSDPFELTDTPSLSVEDFVVRIPSGITSKVALLRVLYEEARLPGYFGFNWDALSDCLRDLHWVQSHDVVLLHADVPALPPGVLRTYLEVLAECVTSWRAGGNHSLRVVFPSTARVVT